MSFYRKITRERTLSSFNDLNTTDEGLKESIARFTRKPREAKLYSTLKIQEDYYSKKGVNDKGSESSVSEAEESDSDNRSYSWRIGDSRDSEDEKYERKERKSSHKKWIPMKWFRKRIKSSDRSISVAKSSYGTDMSYSDTRSDYSKERSERMEHDDRDCISERSGDRKTINARHDMRSNKSRRGYDW